MKKLVITFISDDRPGLVEKLSQMVQQHEGNWLESKMAQLSGKFTGIVEISLPDKQVSVLTQELKALSSEGISLLAEAVVKEPPQAEPPQVILSSGEVSILGMDRPGIVKEISTALAALNINVEEFHSLVEAAPMSSQPLFKADLAIGIPATVNLEQLSEKLDTISEKLDIECTLEVDE
jgi:glycine cleavage system regulatory protein